MPAPRPGRPRRASRAERRGARLAAPADRAGLARDRLSGGPRPAPFSNVERLGLGLVFVLLALLSVRQVASLDAGFHLKTGEYILSGHAPPRTDPFTFTLRDHPYIDTSWGYDVLLALVQRVFGAPGLVVLHAALVLAIFLLVVLTVRLVPADPVTMLLALLGGALASEVRFEIRPELVSYALLALVLYLLHRHAEGRRSPLWALPVIHLVWANLHGLFVLGWMALACFGVGLALRRRALDRRLLLWGACSVAAALVNPYGWRGFLFPLTLATRMSGENVFARSIGEFVSPFDLHLSRQFPFYPELPIFAFRALLVLSLLAAVGLARQKRIWCLLLWLGSLALAYKMIRNLPIFVVASLPGLVWGPPMGKILEGIGLSQSARRLVARAAAGAVAAAAAILALRVVNDGYYIASRRIERFGWGWNRLSLPIDAIQYANRAGLHGPVLNHLNFGGYLMWARADPVFIDGRLEVVGEAFFEEYRNALASEAGLEACAARYGIRWMVFPYASFQGLLGRISKDPRWRLAYVDALAAVFVRVDRDARRSIDPALDRLLKDPPSIPPLDSLPGLGGEPRPGPAERWARGLLRRETFPWEDYNLGLFYTFRGELERAEERFARAIARSRGAYYEIYENLGAVLFRKRRMEDARKCYRLVLREKPGDRLALERLAAIDRELAGGGDPR